MAHDDPPRSRRQTVKRRLGMLRITSLALGATLIAGLLTVSAPQTETPANAVAGPIATNDEIEDMLGTPSLRVESDWSINDRGGIGKTPPQSYVRFEYTPHTPRNGSVRIVTEGGKCLDYSGMKYVQRTNPEHWYYQDNLEQNCSDTDTQYWWFVPVHPEPLADRDFSGKSKNDLSFRIVNVHTGKCLWSRHSLVYGNQTQWSHDIYKGRDAEKGHQPQLRQLRGMIDCDQERFNLGAYKRPDLVVDVGDAQIFTITNDVRDTKYKTWMEYANVLQLSITAAVSRCPEDSTKCSVRNEHTGGKWVSPRDSSILETGSISAISRGCGDPYNGGVPTYQTGETAVTVKTGARQSVTRSTSVSHSSSQEYQFGASVGPKDVFNFGSEIKFTRNNATAEAHSTSKDASVEDETRIDPFRHYMIQFLSQTYTINGEWNLKPHGALPGFSTRAVSQYPFTDSRHPAIIQNVVTTKTQKHCDAGPRSTISEDPDERATLAADPAQCGTGNETMPPLVRNPQGNYQVPIYACSGKWNITPAQGTKPGDPVNEPVLGYQWYFKVGDRLEDVPIKGATTKKFTIVNQSVAAANKFLCVEIFDLGGMHRLESEGDVTQQCYDLHPDGLAESSSDAVGTDTESSGTETTDDAVTDDAVTDDREDTTEERTDVETSEVQPLDAESPTPTGFIGLHPDGILGQKFSYSVVHDVDTEGTRAIGTGMSLAITSGALPKGLTLTTDGYVSGTPQETGEFNFTISDRGAAPSEQALSMRVNPSPTQRAAEPMQLLTAASVQSLQQLTTGVPVSIPLADGISGSANFEVAGELPRGLVLDPVTGVLSGTPTVATIETFSVSDTTRPFAAAMQYEVQVHDTHSEFAGSALPTATAGKPFEASLSTAVGTGALLGFASEAPPQGFDGLSLNALTGEISGTPERAGTVTFRITDLTEADHAVQEFTLQVAPAAKKDASGSAQPEPPKPAGSDLSRGDLASTGAPSAPDQPWVPIAAGVALLVLGAAALLLATRRRKRMH